MAATAPTARASRPTLEPSEEALRPEQSDQQIRREHEGVLERRRQVDDGHALDHADDEGGQQRAEDAAEPAEGDDGVREHGELQSDLRIEGEEVDEDGAGDGEEGGAAGTERRQVRGACVSVRRSRRSRTGRSRAARVRAAYPYRSRR